MSSEEMPSLDPIRDVSLSALAELALFAGSGEMAVLFTRGSLPIDDLVRGLAHQGLIVLERLGVSNECSKMLENIEKGERPTGYTGKVAALLHRIAEALTEDLHKRLRELDQNRGVHDL